jgi:hypothetical protein
MTQTKKQSFTESVTNTAIGFIVSLASSFVLFPLVGFKTNAGINIVVTLYFTAISIIRSYVIRRYFNKKTITGLPKYENPPPPPPKKKTMCEIEGHNMYAVYNLSREFNGSKRSAFGLNKCSRCGLEDHWQYDF